MATKYTDDGRIKRPNKKINYTKNMVLEFARCAQDVMYFAEHYYKIIHPVQGAQIVKLRDYQKRMLKGFVENQMNVVLSSRQSGKTTCSAIYILWFCCFQKDKTVAIVANKASTSKSILEEIKYAWEHIPEFLKPGVKEFNAFSVTFDNECKIIAKATTPDCLRGEAISLLFADEFAFLPPHVADLFWTANYPTLATGGKCIIVSTPNGTGNLFYEIWKQAIEKQGLFNPIKVDWWEVPGRDELWKEKTIKTIGMIKFAQEFGNQFQGSSVTLIEADFIVNKLHKEDPAIVPDDYTHMWEQKIPGHKYCIVVDIGGGVGSDFSVINVFDITSISKGGPAVQVAIWRCNTIPPPKMSEYVLSSARYWNNAYVVIETNPAGYGDDVQKELFDKHDYENLYFDTERAEYGILWTKANKPKACQDFKKDLENQKIIIRDSETIDEIGYFEEQSPGVFKSKQGKNLHDDCVMTCIGFAHFLNSEFFQGELFELEQNAMKKKDPEAWYQTNNTTPDETPLDDTTSEDQEAWDAFIAADEAENDPENWLHNDEVNYFIRNKQKNGTLNQYIDKQRNFHKK